MVKSSMKSLFLLLLSFCLLCSCYPTRLNNQPINKMIGEYVSKNCEANKPCKIQIKDATNFSWDKLYVFDRAVESDVISELLGIKYSSTSPYYSRKWFFVKDNQIVQTEEHILYEIDKSVDNGDVLIEEANPKEKYSIFTEDSLFEVSKNKLNADEHYFYLTCLNCD